MCEARAFNHQPKIGNDIKFEIPHLTLIYGFKRHTSYFLLHYSLFEFKRLCPGLDYPLFLVVYEAGVDQRWLKRLVHIYTKCDGQ